MRALAAVAALSLIVAGQQPLAAQDGALALERPIPYPVDVTHAFQRAVNRGTRTLSGEPGPNYWQQWSDYHIRARVDAEAKRVDGTVRISYHNRSPVPLPAVALQLVQNMHAEGARRNIDAEVTGGMQIGSVQVRGREARRIAADVTPALANGDPTYSVFGTTMMVQLGRALLPGDSAVLDVAFGFTIPQAGASGRMGWNEDNLVYLAYWYPQMAVFDDVSGWQIDTYLGRAEFYMGYGSYRVDLDVPAGWTVMGTGNLTNAEEVLPPPILERLRLAEQSDDVVHVLTPEDFGAGSATTTAESGFLTWSFAADSVRDAAFSLTKASRWDAARTPVGDRNGDGVTDYARVDAIWRETAPYWVNAWRYAQHSIDYLSRWTGIPYPWPHMTAVEGGGLMGGGMEYPMMTLIGDYNERGDTALYAVTAHELAHMWVPMIVGNDERRFAWMDEGTTSFNENMAEAEFFPGSRTHEEDYLGYFEIAGSDFEGEIMRWSDFHSNPLAYSPASYGKPATNLWMLRSLLGEERFAEALQAYLARWAYKHPLPWDMFHTFEDVTGEDLEWFWRTWYYETWTLDQAVADVRLVEGGTQVTVRDLGLAPMPARLTLTLADGQKIDAEIPVTEWLQGTRSAEVVIRTPAPVTRVEIDADRAFPDVNRANNVWERQ
jgi:hypothetical protein